MKKCLPKKQLEIHNQRDILKNVPKEIYQDEKFKDLILKDIIGKDFYYVFKKKLKNYQQITFLNLLMN